MSDFVKDPNANLDYTCDWAAWLDGDVIATSVWTIPSGLSVGSGGQSAFTATTTTVWLAGGTLGTQYEVTNRITTVAGRINDRTFRVLILER